MGLRFIAMEWESYTYYGKQYLRLIYYTKPKYTLDNIPKSFKKTITYSASPMAYPVRFSAYSSSDYYSKYYKSLS